MKRQRVTREGEHAGSAQSNAPRIESYPWTRRFFLRSGAAFVAVLGLTEPAIAGQQAGAIFDLATNLGLASVFSVDGWTLKFRNDFWNSFRAARRAADELRSTGVPIDTSILQLDENSAAGQVGRNYVDYYYKKCLQAREDYIQVLAARDPVAVTIFNLGVAMAIAEARSNEGPRAHNDALDSVLRAQDFARALHGTFPFVSEYDFSQFDRRGLETLRLMYGERFRSFAAAGSQPGSQQSGNGQSGVAPAPARVSFVCPAGWNAQQSRFEATIKNLGGQDSVPFQVRTFLDQSLQPGLIAVPSLPPGGLARATLALKSGAPGRHVIHFAIQAPYDGAHVMYFYIDPSGLIRTDTGSC